MLKLESITKTFNPGTPDEKLALSNLSLHLKEGDFVTIIGANGAGKSTLFNTVCGDILPDSGRVILGGREITYLPIHIRSRQIGRLFQDPMKGTAPGMTIEENLALAAGKGGWLSHVSRSEREEFRQRLSLLNMGLENRMGQLVGSLSGGQRQALSLMMATYTPPKLLLLDEHTAALDPGTADKVLEITQSIVKDNNLTCMMITHNVQSALDLGNRTFMMDGGRIVFDIGGDERARLSVNDLLQRFRADTGRALDNDRMLLS